jgi:hypothetical protein
MSDQENAGTACPMIIISIHFLQEEDKGKENKSNFFL